MFESCLQKQQNLKKLFEKSKSAENKYLIIIGLGKSQKPLQPEHIIEENRVQGCQSTMYIVSRFENGVVHFRASSDALISSGLAELLINVYSGEPPETILKCPPSFIDELGIPASLTPNRTNGLYHIHLRMKQDALKYLL